MQKKTTTFANENDLCTELARLSQQDGGAWVYTVVPFSHEVTLYRFASPCRVPDQFIDLSRGRIWYKGSVVPFALAARIREQNRAIGHD